MRVRLPQKLNLALKTCGFPPLKRSNAYRKIGSGAWHDAYLVYPCQGERLVIRLRKPVIYGQPESFDKRSLREDYEPVGLYYRRANECRPGICPTVYEYHVEPELTFTIESYLGRAISLAALTSAAAFTCGQQVGQFFRAMHSLPPPVPGFGELSWNGCGLEGQDRRALSEIARTEIDAFQTQFDQLCTAELDFDQQTVAAKLKLALAERYREIEPISLINRDITPENLIVRRGNFAGLIDPLPGLGNGLRYAGFFSYCYKSYLPGLADAPRYARHRFRQQAPVMAAIARGYLDGYAQGDTEIVRQLRQEYFLWALDVAHENLTRLQAQATQEIYLRAGDKKAIATRLQRCLRELESYDL